MSEKIIENRIGKTPLVRAPNLEKELGVSKIYLKIEGNNPSGHREDRLAYLIIREALSQNKHTICMGTYGIVGGSLSFLSQFFNIKCVFYTPKEGEVLRKELFKRNSDNVQIVEFGDTYEDCIRESRRIAEENEWFDGNAGLENNIMNMCAFSELSSEIMRQTRKKVDTIFTQTSNGSSVSGLHLGLKQMWIEGEIERLPALYAVSTAYGNAIINCYTRGYRTFYHMGHKEMSIIEPTELNRHLVNGACQNGQDALSAVYDTGGRAVGVSDKELEDNYDFLNENLDEIKLSKRHSYPLVAFIKEVKAGNIKDGHHVIVLNDGKVDIDIRQIEKPSKLPLSFDDFVAEVQKWLLGYHDPIVEITEAVKNALEKGIVLCAYQNNELVGTAIIVNIEFEYFAAKYHLAYITTEKGVKGMGIGTQLLNKAIELTEGNLSLHVDIDNLYAIKLYEKMGFKRSYYRMIHQTKPAPPEID